MTNSDDLTDDEAAREFRQLQAEKFLKTRGIEQDGEIVSFWELRDSLTEEEIFSRINSGNFVDLGNEDDVLPDVDLGSGQKEGSSTSSDSTNMETIKIREIPEDEIEESFEEPHHPEDSPVLERDEDGNLTVMISDSEELEE